MATSSKHEYLGHLGAGIGFVAWALLALLLLLVYGDVDGALLTALPCLLVSAGLWLLVTAATVLLQAVQGRAQYPCVLGGGVATALAVLLLLAEGWLLPVLQAQAGIARILRATGSAMHLPWLLPPLLLAAGAGLLLLPCLQLLRGTPAVPASRAVSRALLAVGLTTLLLAGSRGGGAGVIFAGLPMLLLAVAFSLLWSLVFAAATRLQLAVRRTGAGAALVVVAVIWCVGDHVALPYVLAGTDAGQAAPAGYLAVAAIAQMALLAAGGWLLAVPLVAACRRQTAAARS